jgi:DNA-binding response OmpR family regulator
LSDDDRTRLRVNRSSRGRGSGHGPRTSFEVLLVEDDHDATTLMRFFLEKAGHSVETADTGPAALEAAATRSFDTIILDLGLPDLSGDEVLSELRKRPQLRRTRFICLSGWREQDVDWRALGFDHYLQKPVAFAELARLLGPRRLAE